MNIARNSAHWMPDLIRLAEKFYENNINSRNVKYHKDKFKSINDFCNKRSQLLKNEMYPEQIKPDLCLLDHHKVATVHIESILINQPFINHANSGNLIDMLANEYYCFLVLQAIINAWSCNKIVGKKLNIPNDYRDNLLKIFYKYRNGSVKRMQNTAYDYLLSNIIYFIEKSYLK